MRVDFYNEKVVPAGRTNLSYDDYMSARMAGTIDAYGNPINQDNDNDNNVLTVQQLLAQQQAAANAAASSSNVPTTSQQPGTAYRFMADGGIRNATVYDTWIEDVSVNDYFEVYVLQNTTDSGDMLVTGGSNWETSFSGFILA